VSWNPQKYMRQEAIHSDAWSLKWGERPEPGWAQTARMITLLAVAAAAVTLVLVTSR